jgi:hypothetical protein
MVPWPLETLSQWRKSRHSREACPRESGERESRRFSKRWPCSAYRGAGLPNDLTCLDARLRGHDELMHGLFRKGRMS